MKREDLGELLIEQIGFLDASCAAYDAGVIAEHKRLALTIRVLVHDTGSSQSLLNQLGIKEAVRLIDGTAPGFGNLPSIGSNSVTSQAAFAVIGYYPAFVEWLPAFRAGGLVGTTPRQGFDPWWKDVKMIDSHQEKFNRRRLVLQVANTDGGGHVDPKLEAAFRNLSRGGSMGFRAAGGSIEFSADPAAERSRISPVPASIRHIAEELRVSIRESVPEILGRCAPSPAEHPAFQPPQMYTGGVQFSGLL